MGGAGIAVIARHHDLYAASVDEVGAARACSHASKLKMETPRPAQAQNAAIVVRRRAHKTARHQASATLGSKIMRNAEKCEGSMTWRGINNGEIPENVITRSMYGGGGRTWRWRLRDRLP